jgi:hypothetical protein
MARARARTVAHVAGMIWEIVEIDIHALPKDPALRPRFVEWLRDRHGIELPAEVAAGSLAEPDAASPGDPPSTPPATSDDPSDQEGAGDSQPGGAVPSTPNALPGNRRSRRATAGAASDRI